MFIFNQQIAMRRISRNGRTSAVMHAFSTLNPSKLVIQQANASKRGLGAVLIQKDSEGKDKPVAYLSRSLTPAETTYANIQ